MPPEAAGTARAPTAATAISQRTLDPRTLRLLEGPIASTLLRMAWPNIVVMLAQASTGLIETWWVSHLGLDALAGTALVFPGFMMMQMLSGGAMGGGISSAIARALGGGKRDDANALVIHALLINVALGGLFAALVLGFGPSLYRALGGSGGALAAALLYSNIVFGGTPLVWLMNALASAIRGTGNMLVPSLAVCASVVLLIPLSPCLIFGIGPFPALGVAGAGLAVVSTTALTAAALALYVASGRCVVHFARGRLHRELFGRILKVGGVAAISTMQTTVTVTLATALVGHAGGGDAIAGYGTGCRLEYLLVPLVFGLGAPLVALVGTNIGAGQQQRALRIALTGGAVAFVLSETVGLVAATWPEAWLGLFSRETGMLATGTQYLRIVGPLYGFFGLGLALYFASQGAARLFWPLFAGVLRMLIAVGGGWIALRLTGSLGGLFSALGFGLFVYGVLLFIVVVNGGWFGSVRWTRRAAPLREPSAA